MISDWIRAQHAEGKGQSYKEIAAKLGVSKAHVQNLIGGSRGVGFETEREFARIFYEGSVDALRKAAAEAAAARSTATAGSITPNLRAAIDAMAHISPVPDDVIERARRVAEMGDDLLFETWVALLSDWIRRKSDGSPRRP